MGTTKQASKAAKAQKATATPQTPPAPAPAPQPATVTLAGMPAGYTAASLLRAMGYAGFTAKQGGVALYALGCPVAPSTVTCQVGSGRQYAAGVPNPHHPGLFTPLPAALVAALANLPNVGPPANPHATTAPLPAPQPRAARGSGMPAAPPPGWQVVNGTWVQVPVAAPSTPAKAPKTAPQG